MGDHVKNLSGALKKYELAYSALQAKKGRKKGGGLSERAIYIMERMVGLFGEVRTVRLEIKQLLKEQREEAGMYVETARGHLE